MTTKTTNLLALSSMFLSFAAVSADNQATFEQICGTQNGLVATQVSIGEPITLTPNSGNLLLKQQPNSTLDMSSVVDTLSEKFALSQSCAEFLVINGQVESHNQGDLLARVHFDFDKSNLTPASKKILQRIIDIALVSKDQFTLTGHTDSVGSEAYNFELGIRRAKQVQQYLNDNRVEQIKVESKGETEPVASNQTQEGRTQNRRVDISL